MSEIQRRALIDKTDRTEKSMLIIFKGRQPARTHSSPHACCIVRTESIGKVVAEKSERFRVSAHLLSCISTTRGPISMKVLPASETSRGVDIA